MQSGDFEQAASSGSEDFTLQDLPEITIATPETDEVTPEEPGDNLEQFNDIATADTNLENEPDTLMMEPEQEVSPDEADSDNPSLDMIMGIPVNVQVVLGSAKMPVSKIMKLGRNAIIPLDRNVGDPIDVVINGRIIARGEVVLMEDDNSRFGISITEIVGDKDTCQ